MMGAKNKKSSFVPYTISGQGTNIFPIPAERDAVGVHKKHYPKGVAASKAAKGGELQALLPRLDLNWPGLRVLHLDPPVLVVDNFFSESECDEFAALREGDSSVVHELTQSATFSSVTQTGRTSTTWFCAYQRTPALLARAAALLGVDNLARFEEPQLVRYQPGQYFNWRAHRSAERPSRARVCLPRAALSHGRFACAIGCAPQTMTRCRPRRCTMGDSAMLSEGSRVMVPSAPDMSATSSSFLPYCSVCRINPATKSPQSCAQSGATPALQN